MKSPECPSNPGPTTGEHSTENSTLPCSGNPSNGVTSSALTAVITTVVSECRSTRADP